jgi:predicted alpha/beta-fold hydrolase
MPVIESGFRSPWWMLGGDLQTQLPVLMRRFDLPSKTIAVPTCDNDLLSADFYTAQVDPQKRLLILTHGLEGSNRQSFILGMVQEVMKNGLAGKPADVLAWNLRGCGKPDNKTHKLYFPGSIQDMDDVVLWAENNGYTEIYLASYSLGGNIALKWLAEQGANASNRGIKASCAASVPVDLAGCISTLDRWRNIFYRLYFLTTMKNRLKRKAYAYPNTVDLRDYWRVNSIRRYDETYTAPLNGYVSADAMHADVSSKFVLDKIVVPCLLIDALNDPFFNENCYPIAIARGHPWLTLELTKTGGHVGFYSHQGEWWLEQRFQQFFNSVV